MSCKDSNSLMQAKSQWQNLWMAMNGREPFDITHYSPTSIKLIKIWNKRYYKHSSWQKIAFFHDDNSKNQWQLKGDTEISFWWNIKAVFSLKVMGTHDKMQLKNRPYYKLFKLLLCMTLCGCQTCLNQQYLTYSPILSCCASLHDRRW